MSSKTFPEILKEKRNVAGYTQSETADLLFITRSTYNHYEKGARTPSMDILLKIARLYKINPLDLIAPLIPSEYISDFYLPTNNIPAEYTACNQKLLSTLQQINIT